MAEITYKEICRAKIANTRNAVISKCSKGGFTLAQQLEVQEGQNKTSVFLKGALHIDSLESLCELRNALNVVIKKEQEATNTNDEIEPDEEWD
jgi:hypothetical protein